MKVIIEKNTDVKAMAKLKDLIATLEDSFPGQITMKEVIQIETNNKTLYSLLNGYSQNVLNKQDLFECPRCHKMVTLITKQGVCRPCLMTEARNNAARKLEMGKLDHEHSLMATKIG